MVGMTPIPVAVQATTDFYTAVAQKSNEQMYNQVAQLRTRAERAEAKLREISGLLSYRHGDDGRFDMPEDDENDEQEVVTIKRLFAILEDGE